MDEIRYRQLIEGEAIYSVFLPKTVEELGEFLYTAGLSNNELYHLTAYYWAISLIKKKGEELQVLDAACGSGYGAFLINSLPNVAHTYGVDLNEDQLAYARAHFAGPEFLRGDISRGFGKLPSGQRVDVALSFQTIEHVLDPVAFLFSFWKRLKPEGVFLLASPTHSAAPVFLSESNPYHFVEYSCDLLLELCTFFFDTVRLFDELPEKEAFSVLGDRLPGIGIPKANYIHLSAPKKNIPHALLEAFRNDFTLRIHQTTLSSIQQRLIEKNREAHFLTACYPYIDFLEGYYPPERDHIWLKKKAVVRIQGPLKQFTFSLAPSADAIKMLGRITLEIQDEETGKILRHSFQNVKPYTYTITSPIQERVITISTSTDYCPAEHGSNDLRRLALMLFEVQWSEIRQ